MNPDADIKPEIMRSMEMSWTPRPLYSTRAQDTTPTGVRKDRRVRKIKRAYYHLKDDFGLVVIVLAIFGGCVAFWLALAQVLAWLR